MDDVMERIVELVMDGVLEIIQESRIPEWLKIIVMGWIFYSL